MVLKVTSFARYAFQVSLRLAARVRGLRLSCAVLSQISYANITSSPWQRIATSIFSRLNCGIVVPLPFTVGRLMNFP